uniref:Uncharacterized protein n=1 Tax=Ditylenchus dipsaci TaxID=166011 RepID=A0A915E4S8_9BILA
MFLHCNFAVLTTPLGFSNSYFYYVQSGSQENTTKLFRINSLKHLPDGAQLLATFDQPIRYFQRATKSACSRYFYCIGKDFVADEQGYFFVRRISRVLEHRPGLFCGSNGLFLCYNYITSRRRDGSKLSIETGTFVKPSCCFRLHLNEQDFSLKLEELKIPWPPLKPARRFDCLDAPINNVSNRFWTKTIPDDLRFHFIFMDDHKITIFNLNTNGKCHVYDGKDWTEYTPDDSFDAQESVEITKRISYGLVGEGPLYEILVHKESRTFRANLLCPRMQLPKDRTVVCSDKVFAFSYLNHWKHSDGQRWPSSDQTNGYIQFLLDEPPWLSCLAYWGMQKCMWPIEFNASEFVRHFITDQLATEVIEDQKGLGLKNLCKPNIFVSYNHFVRD